MDRILTESIWVQAIKGVSILLKAPKVEHHHYRLFSVILRTLIFEASYPSAEDAVGVF